jgi:ankyrin repeat protein
MLLKRGSRIDICDNGGRTALHRAVLEGEIQAVRLLLEHGADVNVRDNSGGTPSRRRGYHEIVELLSGYGAGSVQ